MVKKLLCWAMISVLALTVIVGCEESEPAAIDLVPQNANLIGSIQVSKILNDQDLIDAYDRVEKEPGEPQTFEDLLNEAVEESGIDFRESAEAVVFADLTAFEMEEYIGVIVECTISEKQFARNFEEMADMEFVTSDYKGYRLYIDEADEFGIAFLSDQMLITGSTKAVKDVIDVRRGDRKQITGTILDTYQQLGDVLIKVAFELPEEARKALVEESVPGEIPISLEYLADMDMIGFALDKEGETIDVNINPHFLSVDSAEDVNNTLSGAILFSRGMVPDPDIKELLSKINVSVTDTWVTIALEITVSEIEQLVGKLRQ